MLFAFIYFHICSQTGERRPAVIVIHAFLGRTHHEDDVARRLGALGFVAFSADIFGETHTTREGGFKAVHALREERETKMRSRIEAALKVVSDHPHVDPEKIAAIGYCFGGELLLLLWYGYSSTLGC